MDASGWQTAAALAATAVAVAAGCIAWAARRDSARSNVIAAEALGLAKSAEARAARTEELAVEKTDVEWHPEWLEAEHRLALHNIGTTAAHDVLLAVTDLDTTRTVFDDPADLRVEQAWPLIEPGDRIAAATGAMVSYHRFVHAAPNPLNGKAVLHVRVTWRSEAGKPFVREFPDLRV